MESFSLLKYWRASTTIAAISTGGHGELPSSTTAARSTTSAPSPYSHTTVTEELEAGSFFDLELSSLLNERDVSDLASESQEEAAAAAAAAAAKHKHIFTSLVSLAAADTKTLQYRPSPASLLKSATRFRVFALGLNKKLKSDASAGATVDSPKSTTGSSSGNNFFVEVFAGSRNNSSKSKAQDQDVRDSAEEEKKKSKEAVQKYISSKIKPLYVRVCRRYGERLSVPRTAAAAGGDPTKRRKKVVMLKSRSAVAMVPPTAATAAAVRRRDDSLLQQEDGIQSAIAHCKKSFHASSTKETETLAVDEGQERMV